MAIYQNTLDTLFTIKKFPIKTFDSSAYETKHSEKLKENQFLPLYSISLKLLINSYLSNKCPNIKKLYCFLYVGFSSYRTFLTAKALMHHHQRFGPVSVDVNFFDSD